MCLLVLDRLISAVLCQLVLLALQEVDDVLSDGRQLQLYVLHQHHIHRLHQRLDAQLVGNVTVLVVLSEVFDFLLLLLLDSQCALGWPQVNASVSQH